MSSLINTNGQSNDLFQEEVYDNRRRQKKYFEMEIKKLKEEVRQMQEKLDSLQQKKLQGDLGRGRNAMKKTKFNKFNHINMMIVLAFCKNRMFPIYKFLEPSMLIFSFSSKQSLLCVKLSGLIEKPRELNTRINHEFFWSNNIVPMINNNFNTEVKRVYIGEFEDVTYQSFYLYCV
jgi:hypothetical protein